VRNRLAVEGNKDQPLIAIGTLTNLARNIYSERMSGYRKRLRISGEN